MPGKIIPAYRTELVQEMPNRPDPWRTLNIILLLGLGACAKPETVASPPPDRFANRDGAREVWADVRAGAAPRLYWHAEDGFAPGSATPGIVGCDPQPSATVTFIGQPEARFQEGEPVVEDRLRRAVSAIRFARTYNRTMFEAYRAEIKVTCPHARLQTDRQERADD